MERADKRPGSRVLYWKCKCDCGSIKRVRHYSLLYGLSRSCGCLKRESLSSRTFRHGQINTRAYNTWRGMKGRCTNQKDSAYSRYGARGITVCDEWRRFEGFVADMGQPPSARHTLDRIDNNKGYFKANCRWADPKTQARNQRKFTTKGIVSVRYQGETLPLVDWAERTGIKIHVLRTRLKLGWAVEKMFRTEVKKLSARHRGERWRRLDLLAGEEGEWQS